MIKMTDILIEQFINGAPSLEKVKKVKKSLPTDRDYVYEPVHEQDTTEIDQHIKQSQSMPIVQRIALINQIRKVLGEGKVKKVTKQMWKKMKEDQRINALLSVFKDPDDAIEHWEKDWDKLPRTAKVNDMHLFEGKIAGFHTLQEDGIAKINGHEMGIEIQSTPEGLEKGLMFRNEIPSGKGMLLKFGKDNPTKIWMKNVKQPLDIIYIKDDKVVDMFKNAMPDLGDGIFDSIAEVICDMVLELPAGDIDKFNIKSGDMFGFNDLRRTNINQ